MELYWHTKADFLAHVRQNVRQIFNGLGSDFIGIFSIFHFKISEFANLLIYK